MREGERERGRGVTFCSDRLDTIDMRFYSSSSFSDPPPSRRFSFFSLGGSGGRRRRSAGRRRSGQNGEGADDAASKTSSSSNLLHRFASSSSSSLPLAKSALTSAGMGCIGDCVAQRLDSGWKNGYDFGRTGRQTSFNLAFYGPLQHVWYRMLGRRFPAGGFTPFALKLFLNQTVLGPIVVVSFFAWSQTFTNAFTFENWTNKVKRDALPTFRQGWSFWVPASAVNFALVTVDRQVLYMSCFSIVWNCILSQAGNK